MRRSRHRETPVFRINDGAHRRSRRTRHAAAVKRDRADKRWPSSVSAFANAIRRKHRALDFRVAGVYGEGLVHYPADPVEPLRDEMQSKQQDRDRSALPLHGFADPREKRIRY